MSGRDVSAGDQMVQGCGVQCDTGADSDGASGLPRTGATKNEWYGLCAGASFEAGQFPYPFGVLSLPYDSRGSRMCRRNLKNSLKQCQAE